MGSSDCRELLKLPQEQLTQGTLELALITAVRSGNCQNLVMVLLREPANIDEAIQESRTLKNHMAMAVLIAAKAAIENDVALLLNLWRGVEHQRAGLCQQVCRCVISGDVRLVFAIELARRHNSSMVRTELLLRTDVDYTTWSVLWFGLKLHQLEETWFRRVTWAKKINLAKNRLVEFPATICQSLTHCTLLNLQHNSLKEVPSDLLTLPCLCTLVLCHNQLVAIPGGTWSCSLMSLDLCHNQLVTLPPDCQAEALTELHLSHNQIVELPCCVMFFYKLTTLDISNNPSLSSLPPQLGLLKNLSKLMMDDLPALVSPPKTSCATTTSVLSCLRGRLLSYTEQYQMKLVVMGNTATGKSTLVNLLCGREGRSNSVAGAIISRWKHSPNKLLPSITFTVWDLTGYQDCYAAHECLLTPRCLYVVMWRLIDGTDGIGGITPWLNMLNGCVPNCRVVVVATHLDHMSEDNSLKVNSLLRSVQQLTEQYPNLIVTHATAVSLGKSSNNVHQLKDLLYNAASGYHVNSATGVGAMIPSSYKQLEQLLVANVNAVMDHNFIYNLVCIKLPILCDKADLLRATQFLHEIGSIYHYDNISWHGLNDCYFTNPSWMVQLLYKIITVDSGNPFVKKGILYTKYLPILFKGDEFRDKNVSYYLSLLNKLDLIVPLDRANRFIMVPSKLPAVEPVDMLRQLEVKPSYCRFVVFDHGLPHGLCGRLISRMLSSIPELQLLLGEQAIEDKGKSLVVSSRVVLPQRRSSNANRNNKSKQTGLNSDEHYLDCNIYKDDMKFGCWATGMFYWNHYDEVFFCINAQDQSIQLSTSHNDRGHRLLCHMITVLHSCLDDWYPGLRCVGVAPCNICLRQHVGEYPHSHFHIEDCMDYIIRGNLDAMLTCARYHKVSLQDLVPDLLLDKKYLLAPSECRLKRNRKRIGSFDELFIGKFRDVPAAFKPYHHGDVTHSLRQLLLEAHLLDIIRHPCMINLIGVLPCSSQSYYSPSLQLKQPHPPSMQPHPFSKTEAASRQPHPSPLLVLENYSMGTLDEVLITMALPRLLVYRMATQIISAFINVLLCRPSSQLPQLSPSNVLVCSMSLDQPINCKLVISDLRPHHISTELTSHHHDNSSMDITSVLTMIGRFLHQLIYLQPPSTTNKISIPFGYYYLHQLTRVCLLVEPHPLVQDQISLQEVMSHLYKPLHQLVMHEVSVSNGLISCACAVQFDQSESSDGYYEVWTCCNDDSGARISIFPANEMQRPLLFHLVNNYQVRHIYQCGDLVWVPSWAGLESGVIDLFDVYSKQLVHVIKMRDTCVSCISCSSTHVYCGTIEGYCFMLPITLAELQISDKPKLHYVSEYCVTGMLATPEGIWVAAHDAIHILEPLSLVTITSLKRKGLPDSSDLIGSLVKSNDRVWSVQFGGFLVSSWDVNHLDHHGDVNVYYTLKARGCDQQGSIITAFQPVMDVLWVGVVSGHILLLDMECGSLLSLFQPYITPVRFLISILHFGIMTDHVMLSGGRCRRRRHASDIPNDNSNSNHDDNYLIMWEVLPSRRLHQLEQLRATQLWRNNDGYQAGILHCGFENSDKQRPQAGNRIRSDASFVSLTSTIQLTVVPPGGKGRETVLARMPLTLGSLRHDISKRLGLSSDDAIQLRVNSEVLDNDDIVQQQLQSPGNIQPIISVTFVS